MRDSRISRLSPGHRNDRSPNVALPSCPSTEDLTARFYDTSTGFWSSAGSSPALLNERCESHQPYGCLHRKPVTPESLDRLGFDSIFGHAFGDVAPTH